MKASTILLAAVLLLASAGAAALASPNPYGIAGWGQLARLGMPADCIDYDWNGLHTGSLVQMCRPNHYYEYIGIAPRWWSWNQNTGQINDPVQLAAWVTSNPGKIWIISNEPDLNSQDGLTREQYAAMFKTYHDFIGQLDPTARFCIGAITGGSTTAAFNYTRDWYQYVLDYYKTTYAEPMPVDIWNIHSYLGPAQIEDPDQPIRDFVQPFVSWCHTVDGGRYAGAEVWITELPIGEWMGALNQDWIIWFAQRYLPRLERAGIARWFWFVSVAGDEWSNVALVNADRTISPLGEAYRALATGYPNPVPPVEPFVPQPAPRYFADDFSSGDVGDPWMVKAGDWSAEGGSIRQRRVDYPFNGETCVVQHRYGDFNARLQMRVNNASNSSNWAGLAFHLQGRFVTAFNNGYLVYMRRSGSVGLYNAADGSVLEVPAAVPDASQWQTIRIQMTGWRIQVWANETPIIDWTDANHRWAEGYLALQTHRTDSSYAGIHITRLPNAPSVQQPPLSSSLTTLTATWSAEPPPWGVAQKQYAIVTTPAAMFVRDWTPAPDAEIVADGLSLSLGTTYYVSVRFQDSDGLWSATGTGPGTSIIPESGPSPIALAKMKADGESVAPFLGLVSAGNDAMGGYLYIQDFERTAGIRVTGTSGVSTGTIASIAGKMGRIGYERCLLPTSVTALTRISPPEPLQLSAMNLAGTDWPAEPPAGAYQRGVAGSLALNNVGLLVTVHGRVLASRSSSFTLWDGSAWDMAHPPTDPYGQTGVLVLTRGLASASVGQIVRVTGISSLVTTASGPRPQVLIRTAADVQVLSP